MHCGVIMGTTVSTICKSYISTTDICGHPRSADYLKPFRQKRAHFLVATNWNVIYRTQIIIDIILAIAAVLMAAVGLNGINRPAHCWCCCCCCCWDRTHHTLLCSLKWHVTYLLPLTSELRRAEAYANQCFETRSRATLHHLVYIAFNNENNEVYKAPQNRSLLRMQQFWVHFDGW